ncbi:MAG TPA: sigma-54 dependent transcriptional regulator, partial [Longimicrobiales bacterium]|nr:sigma-54 dependent transcriptional regulator [Longimicrobiales bacterium]
ALSGARPEVALVDVRMPGMDGLELLRLLRERSPHIAVVVMSAYEDLATVATAMRDGAVDFLVKPLDLHQVRQVVESIHKRPATPISSGAPSDAPETDSARTEIVGHTHGMIEVFKRVGQASGNRATVLIRGASGTGKELVARSIHQNSEDAAEPFVAVNCAALPEGLLESELFGHVKGAFTGASGERAGRFVSAGRGTIFLDEIGDTSPRFQSRLLRVLQEQEVYAVGSDEPRRTEARVIAATHRDLESLLDTGEFRTDLYYRIRVIEIDIPPLRERPDDIRALSEHLVRRVSRDLRQEPPMLTDEAVAVLTSYEWPGNVRELENCLARAVVAAVGSSIRPEHLSLGRPRRAESTNLGSLEDAEREHLERVLKAVSGRKKMAAEVLGVSRTRLDRLIKKYGLENLAPGRSGSA